MHFPESFEPGVFYAIMALGVYLSFRILDFPDLTVDGSFTTGAAIAAMLITLGMSPWFAAAIAFFGGLTAGCVTGLLHAKGKINPLLAGILTMTALYSINLRIMNSNSMVSMLGETTYTSHLKSIVSFFVAPLEPYAVLLGGLVIVLLLKGVMDWFLNTEVGLVLRATGDNARMIRSLSANTDRAKILGLALSNGLVALSGAFVAQYDGFASVNMGVGMIIVGLASVIIGENVFGKGTVGRTTLSVIGGSVIYWLVVSAAFSVGLKASDMKLITAVIVVAALIVPQVSYRWREKRRKKRRITQYPVSKEGGRRDAASESHRENI